MDIELYKQNEAQALIDHIVTKEEIVSHEFFRKKITEETTTLMPLYKLMVDLAVKIGATSVLDIGCVVGQEYDVFKKYAPEIKYTGIEIKQEYVEQGLKVNPEADYRKVDSYLTLPFKDNEFDVVTLRSVLRHYYPIHGYQIIEEALRVSKIGIMVNFGNPPAEMDYLAEARNNVILEKNTTFIWNRDEFYKFLNGKVWKVFNWSGNSELYLVRK